MNRKLHLVIKFYFQFIFFNWVITILLFLYSRIPFFFPFHLFFFSIPFIYIFYLLVFTWNYNFKLGHRVPWISLNFILKRFFMDTICTCSSFCDFQCSIMFVFFLERNFKIEIKFKINSNLKFWVVVIQKITRIFKKF